MEDLKLKNIFLIDAIGAVVSIISLCTLYSFEELSGMPKGVLGIFIGIAILFSIYSFTCYFSNLIKWRFFLFTIAILNIGYCVFTIYHIFQNSNRITFLGYVYFVVELSIVLTLSFYEIKLSRKKNLST